MLTLAAGDGVWLALLGWRPGRHPLLNLESPKQRPSRSRRESCKGFAGSLELDRDILRQDGCTRQNGKEIDRDSVTFPMEREMSTLVEERAGSRTSEFQ